MENSCLVFAGTTEGRELSVYLAKKGVRVLCYVATEYGEILLPRLSGLSIHSGRLGEKEMAVVFSSGQLVVDATHPYAAEVTKNLKAACEKSGAEYLRLLRAPEDSGDAVAVESAAAAVDYLNRHEGKALLTTGSKELAAFRWVKDGPERLYARVLPTVEALAQCKGAGLDGPHIIAMQGPFSHEMNLATLRQTGVRYLVTKDGGTPGGFPEKLSAAKEAGVTVILVSRPGGEQGLSLSQAKSFLSERLGILPETANSCFPLFVDLFNQPVLVAGAGKIASRRTEVLLRYGAAVLVVAPKLSKELTELSAAGRIRVLLRCFQAEDLAGMRLAVAATDSREANRMLGEEAKKRGIPVSVADARDESSFFFPAVFEGGGVTGGLISYGGRDHALARKQAARLRELLS